jgi:hypothetical protein
MEPITKTEIDPMELRTTKTEIELFVDWVECWVTLPVSAFSHAALEGIFSMTRDRIKDIKARPNQSLNIRGD